MQVMLESDAGPGANPKSFANLWVVAGCKPRPDVFCRLSYFQIQDSASGIIQTVELVYSWHLNLSSYRDWYSK